MIQKSKVTFDYKKSLTVFMAFFPILNQYSIGSLPFGDLISLFYIVLFVFFFKNKLDINFSRSSKIFFIFLLYVFLSLPLLLIIKAEIDFFDIFTKSFHLILYSVFAFIVAKKMCDLRLLSYLVKKISIFCSYILIIEQILSVFFHVRLYLLIPFLRLNYALKSYDDYVRTYSYVLKFQSYRPTAIFLEPSHACMYVIIGLAIILSQTNKSKSDFIHIFVIVLSIICSYSTSGMLCGLFCISYYAFFVKSINKKEVYFKCGVVTICLLGVLFVVVGNEDIFKTLYGRIEKIGTDMYDSSGNRRVLRGLYVWNDMPMITKLFGTGLGCLLQDIANNNIMVLTDTEYIEEMNTVFCTMSTFGLTGSILYFTSIIKNLFYKQSTNLQRMVIVSYLFSCFYSNWIYHAVIILYYIFIFYDDDYINENKYF